MIRFFTESISFTLKDKTKIKKWIETIILKEKNKLGDINYIFCSDEYLYKMNVEFLKHKTYTDIITFDYCKEKGNVSGDIFISVDRVKENAKTYNTNFTNELHRVLAHGVLHLLGYKDKTKKEEELMRKIENKYLKTLKATL